MIPKSLSATSCDSYETCPARWKANYIDRAAEEGSSAASLGTACHAALEHWIADGHYTADLERDEAMKVIKKLFTDAYRELFADDARFAEGLGMCVKWLDRQDWSGREVLSTEQKLEFPLPTSIGDIPFRYIWDRCDRLDDGSIEVVDYKTIMRPVQPEDLKHKIQPRAYALAAQLQYPDAKRIWVTYDMLRYEPVGVVFTVEENRETYRYLRNLAERIIADDAAPERLNANCRWCVRRHACETLQSHASVGGVYGITDPKAAADRRADLIHQKTAIELLVNELDEMVLQYMEESDTLEFRTERTKVVATTRATRTIDSERAAGIIGPDLLARYGKLNVSAVDEMLKGTELDDTEKSQLRQLIRKQHGKISLKTDPIAPTERTDA